MLFARGKWKVMVSRQLAVFDTDAYRRFKVCFSRKKVIFSSWWDFTESGTGYLTLTAIHRNVTSFLLTTVSTSAKSRHYARSAPSSLPEKQRNNNNKKLSRILNLNARLMSLVKVQNALQWAKSGVSCRSLPQFVLQHDHECLHLAAGKSTAFLCTCMISRVTENVIIKDLSSVSQWRDHAIPSTTIHNEIF